MRIAQTTAIVFVSKVLASALGFVATVYFARFLGSEVLGQYFLILALVGWIAIFGQLGLVSAITKRLSEGKERSAYMIAGGILIAGFAGLLAVAVLLFSPWVNEYVGSSLAAPFVAVLIVISLGYSYVTSCLEGHHLVHIAGMLEPIKIGSRSVFQIALVVSGFGLVGMLTGYAVGGVIIGFLGLYFLTFRLTRPGRRHIQSLFDFAKYSWLGGVRSRSYREMDILVLGVFVPASLVGIYGIAWSLAAFLSLFGTAISRAIFPEISKLSAERDEDARAGIITDSLAYAGLLVIPGLVGGILLAERLLLIYGPEFVEAATVLGILIAAVLLYNYQKQCLSALKGINRPDLSFRVNAVFVGSNVVLNIVLIWSYGILGAAVATLLSTSIGFVLSYWYLSVNVQFAFPTDEVGRQVLAAGVMAGVVILGEVGVQQLVVIDSNTLAVVLLVGVGAVAYFITLTSISRDFRAILSRNIGSGFN